MSERRWQSLCATIEVLPGEMKSFWLDELPILVANLDGQFYALEDKCSHEDYELSSGQIDAAAGSVECTLHGAKFDLRNGEALCAPAYTPVRKFETRVDNGAVYVQVD